MGLTVVDSGVVIGYFEPADAHYETTYRALVEVRGRGDQIVLPASAYAEGIVYPLRQGPEQTETFREFVRGFPMEIVELDEEIAEAAARLRADHGTRLPLPDALVIATAQVIEADTLITTDRGWPDAESLALEGELIVL